MNDILDSHSERAIILAPHGRDAMIAADILRSVGIASEICPDMPALVRAIAQGAGFALVTDEALRNADLKDLSRWLSEQPPWSDFAFVLLTLRGGGIERNPALARLSEVLGNVVFLERPFHPGTLVSVARSALRGRLRQYEARARLEDLHKGEERLRGALDKERRAAEHQRVLINELNHRVKNSLAVALALADQTRRACAAAGHPPERFHADFQTRLLALATAHDLLTREHWEGAPLTKLVQTALAPHAGAAGWTDAPVQAARVSANGPPVRLAPETALALAMAMHELATNAAKHGALSVPTGRVAVDWRVEPPPGGTTDASDGTLLLEWSEHGGPPVSGPPTRRGFGSRLIERGLPVQLGRGGAVSLEFAPPGLRCRIRAPLRPGVVGRTS